MQLAGLQRQKRGDGAGKGIPDDQHLLSLWVQVIPDDLQPMVTAAVDGIWILVVIILLQTRQKQQGFFK